MTWGGNGDKDNIYFKVGYRGGISSLEKHINKNDVSVGVKQINRIKCERGINRSNITYITEEGIHHNK